VAVSELEGECRGVPASGGLHRQTTKLIVEREDDD